MSRRASAIVAALLLVSAARLGAAPRPAGAAMDDGTAAVRVNDESITVGDIVRQIGSAHAGVSETPVRRPDLSALLERMIGARLVVQEARRIGLDQQPEFTTRAAAARLALVKSLLVRAQVDGITEGEPEAVDRLYKDAVRTWVIESLLFTGQDDARAFSDAVRGGASFSERARQAVAGGVAQGGGGARPVKPADLRPEVAKALMAMRPGETGAPIQVPGGWTVVRLAEVRYPVDAAALEQARQDALEARRQARLEGYMAELRRRYVTVDRALLSGLDYQSEKPGLETLRKDERILARIKGGEPVRVRDLTAAVEARYYHGVEGAIERKRVNDDLSAILDRLVLERATILEARRLGLEKGAEFRLALGDRLDSLLFETFVQKVVDPTVKLAPADLRAWYDAHRADYTTPEMMRLDSLAFRRPQDAQAALDRLRGGTEFAWVRDHADGQVERDDPSVLRFGGDLTTTASLPAGVRRAVAGARAGEARFYGEPGGPFYVLSVRQSVPAVPQPYETVQNDVTTKAFVEWRQKSLDDWVAKLRAASKVTVLIGGPALADRLGLGPAGGV